MAQRETKGILGKIKGFFTKATCCEEDKIAKRAYELYEKRGKQPGHEMEDWLQAEAEVKKKAPKK